MTLRSGEWITSYEGRAADALAQMADEGRGQPRNATVRCKQPETRRFPNGATRHHQAVSPSATGRLEAGEGTETSQYLVRRNRRDSLSSGERTGNSLNQSDVKLVGVVRLGLWEQAGAATTLQVPEHASRTDQESPTREGNSPVDESVSRSRLFPE